MEKVNNVCNIKCYLIKVIFKIGSYINCILYFRRTL